MNLIMLLIFACKISGFDKIDTNDNFQEKNNLFKEFDKMCLENQFFKIDSDNNIYLLSVISLINLLIEIMYFFLEEK